MVAGAEPPDGYTGVKPCFRREIQNGRAKATSLLASKQHASDALDGYPVHGLQVLRNDVLCVWGDLSTERMCGRLIPATSDHYPLARGAEFTAPL